MKKILPILVTTALLALAPSARAQAPASAPAVAYPSGYTPPPYTPTPAPAPVPIEKRTGMAYRDALCALPDYPLKQSTRNLWRYTTAALWLVRFITEDISLGSQDRVLEMAAQGTNWTSLEKETLMRTERCLLTIHEMEMWWDGMDANERDQARSYNAWMVERLRKDGKPVPGIFCTNENRKP